jgi:hypothetical protein
MAPVATWAGVTRDDEPGCDDPARHRGTALRMVARDTVVTERVSRLVKRAGRRAVVVSGQHDYGRQLDGQLKLAHPPRTEDPKEGRRRGSGRSGRRARDHSSSRPVAASCDRVRRRAGAQLGAGREIRLALPVAPGEGCTTRALLAGSHCARRAAEMVVAALERVPATAQPCWLSCVRGAPSMTPATRSTHPYGCGRWETTGHSSLTRRSSRDAALARVLCGGCRTKYRGAENASVPRN